MQIGLAQWTTAHLYMGVLLLFGLAVAIDRSKNSMIGVALLLGFTFFAGLMASQSLRIVLGLPNGVHFSTLAFDVDVVSLLIFQVAALLALLVKHDLGGLGFNALMRYCFALPGLGVIVVAAIWQHHPPLSAVLLAMLVVSAVTIGMFTALVRIDAREFFQGVKK